MEPINYLELLLVEDNPADAELAIRALHKKYPHHTITHAHDGQEALDFVLGLTTKPEKAVKLPGLIFLDLKLPKINGLQVLEKIKQNEETRAIPVIVLSSSKETGDIKKAYQMGANSFVVKPVSFEDYEQTLDNLAHYWLTLNQSPIK
ncbi:MAG: response regulator [Salinivirgaceae bacterium]|jgi:two-component system response regulator